MKKTKRYFDICATVGVLLLIVTSFLKLWVMTVNGEAIPGAKKYGIFSDFTEVNDAYKALDKATPGIWKILVAIFTILAIVAGIAYIVFTVFELLKNEKLNKLKNKLYKRIASYVMLGCFLLICIFGAVLTAVSEIEMGVIGMSYTAKLVAKLPFYLLVAAPLLSGVFGLMATCKKEAETQE